MGTHYPVTWYYLKHFRKERTQWPRFLLGKVCGLENSNKILHWLKNPSATLVDEMLIQPCFLYVRNIFWKGQIIEIWYYAVACCCEFSEKLEAICRFDGFATTVRWSSMCGRSSCFVTILPTNWNRSCKECCSCPTWAWAWTYQTLGPNMRKLLYSTPQAAWQMSTRNLEVYEGSESMHRTQHTTRKATKPCGRCDSAGVKCKRHRLDKEAPTLVSSKIGDRIEIAHQLWVLGRDWSAIWLLDHRYAQPVIQQQISGWLRRKLRCEGYEGGTFVRLLWWKHTGPVFNIGMLRQPGGLKRQLIQNEIRRITIIHNVQNDPQCHNTS